MICVIKFYLSICAHIKLSYTVILSHAFQYSIEMLIWVFCFLFYLIGDIYLLIFMFKQSCISGINSTWSWCVFFLYVSVFSLLVFY